MFTRPFSSSARSGRLLRFLAAVALALIAALTSLPAAEKPALPGQVAVLKGHKENVFSVVFSPDGKRLVSVSGDPSVKVWDAATGKQIKGFAASPTTHNRIVLCAAVSPDGGTFVTGSADNTAKFWDMPTTSHLLSVPQPDNPSAAAVSYDGKRLAAGGADGKVRLYDDKGKLEGELPGAGGAARAIAFSGNGQLVAAQSADGVVRLWNAQTRALVARFAAQPGEGSGIGFHPTQPTLYTAGADGALKFWTTNPGAAKPLSAGGGVARSFETDGATIALAAGKQVVLSQLATGAGKSAIPADVELTSAAIGGGHIAAGSASREALVWSAKDNKLIARLPAHKGRVVQVTINPAGNQLATAGEDGVVRVWALPVAPPRKLDTAGAIADLVLLSDGKRLVTAGADKIVRTYQLTGAMERQLTGHPGPVRSLALAGDNVTPISGGEDGTIRVWGAKGDTSVVLGAHEGAVTSLVNVSGRVLSSSADGSVKMWQPAAPTGKETLTHAGAVTAVAVSPNSALLLTACDDRQVRLWSLASGKLERTYTGPTMSVTCVAWSRDGGRIAAGSSDRSLYVWESGSVKEVRKFTGLPAGVVAVALPADGKGVLAGLADGSVQLLEIATGKTLKTFTGPRAALTDAALPPKNDVVLTGHSDGTVASHPLAGGAAKTWKAAGPVAALASRPDSMAVALGGGKAVQVFSPDGKELAKFAVPASVRGLAYSSDGKKLAVACEDGKARVYDPEGRLMEYMPHDGAVGAVAFASEGRLLVSGGADKKAMVRPVSLVWLARPGGAIARAINTNRGVLLACGDGAVRLINSGDGKVAQTIKAHKGAVVGLSASSNLARLATIGADGLVNVFEMAKPDKPAHSIKLPATAISVSLSPNGARLAVGVPAAKGHRIHVHDGGTGQPLLELGEVEPVSANVLAWQGDNRTLLAAGEDKRAQFLDVSVLLALDAHKGGVTSVAWCPNAPALLTAGADKAVTRWDLATGKVAKSFGPMAEAPAGIAWSRDAQQVAAVAGKKLSVWSTADGKAVAEMEAPAAQTAVSFNSDRTRLITAGRDGRARVWEVALKREVMAFLHEGPVTVAAWHPSQPAVAFTAGEDKQAWMHTLPLARVVVAGAPLRSLAVSNTGAYVLVAGDDGKLRRYNGGGGGLEREFTVGGKGVVACAITRSEAVVAGATADNKVRLFGSGDGKLIGTIALKGAARGIAFSPDNKGLVAALPDGTLLGLDVQFTPGMALPDDFGKVSQSFKHGTGVSSVAFARDGGNFWTAGDDKSVKMWKLASDAPTRSLAHPNSVNALVFNKEGTQLVTGCSDGNLRVFDAVKGNLVRQINAHPPIMGNPQAIYGVALTADGKRAATASADGSFKVFELASGALVREVKAFNSKTNPQGHEESVLTVAFSPDGKLLATGGMDQKIKVWSVADGKLQREFANPGWKGVAHPGWVYAVRWTSDGKHIVSAGSAPKLTGYFAVWEANTGKLVSGQELKVGTIYSVALSPDEKLAALGTGGSIRGGSDVHQGIVLKVPGR